MQTSQNKCPHLVVTRVRPNFINCLVESMQIGQLMVLEGESAGGVN